MLPRGQMPNPLREKNEKTNEYVRQKLSSKRRVEIIPASKTLIQADGSISHHDMPDYLSLTEAGYRKIFEPIYELILQLFGENDVEKTFNDWVLSIFHTDQLVIVVIVIERHYCFTFSPIPLSNQRSRLVDRAAMCKNLKYSIEMEYVRRVKVLIDLENILMEIFTLLN